MNIHGKKILLRAIEEEDLPTLHKWANDPGLWHMLVGWHFPTSIRDQKEWFAGLAKNHLHQRFAISEPDLGLIGTTNLIDIDWKNNHAHHGIMIGDKDNRGKGYGIDTIMTIMRYAFEELHLERLDSSIIEYNKISRNIYCKKCGWQEEGRQKKWFFRKNRYWDRIIIGILRDDYFELIKNSKYWES
jgi:RimJ/RimL family protein N-acetyltransferase